MSPGWSLGSYSAMLLLVVGAVGFLLGISLGSIVATARARRLRDLPPGTTQSPEFWRVDDRSRWGTVAAVSEGVSMPAEPSQLPTSSIAATPPMPRPSSTRPMPSIGARPLTPADDSSRTEFEPDPMASMTDAEIDAMAAEVPARVPHRRRRPTGGPKQTVHRL
jgi:hypothetical protein